MKFKSKATIIVFLLGLLFLTGCGNLTKSSEEATKDANSSAVASESSTESKTSESQLSLKPDFETQDIDVPLNAELSEEAILNHVVSYVTGDVDGSFRESMIIQGLENVDFSTVGEYEITVLAGSDLTEWEDESVDIYVKEDITDIQIHVEFGDD